MAPQDGKQDKNRGEVEWMVKRRGGDQKPPQTSEQDNNHLLHSVDMYVEHEVKSQMHAGQMIITS